MNPVTEAQLEQKLEADPQVQRTLHHLAVRRITSALLLIAALGLFLLWLPATSRQLLVRSLVANRLVIALLLLFGLVALSLLWSAGQKFDVWLFQSLNLRTKPALWVDEVMWIATQLGTFNFATIVVLVAYVLGYHRFAIGLVLGSLTLLLLITIIKAFADRARPYKILLETRVVGWREIGLSFPSGHTAQTFFLMTLAVRYFQFSLAIAAILYGAAVMVGISRIYLGVHYPRDVVAGAIVGLIWGNVGALVAPYLWG